MLLTAKKAPDEDGITGDIFQRAYKQFPNLINTLYNECLRQGCFPKSWKKVKVIPITRPGKEGATDPSKFRPINLINAGGKVLEKALINRIMHHVHINNFWIIISLNSLPRNVQQTLQLRSERS
jgi:hypothetical protein